MGESAETVRAQTSPKSVLVPPFHRTRNSLTVAAGNYKSTAVAAAFRSDAIRDDLRAFREAQSVRCKSESLRDPEG